MMTADIEARKARVRPRAMRNLRVISVLVLGWACGACAPALVSTVASTPEPAGQPTLPPPPFSQRFVRR